MIVGLFVLSVGALVVPQYTVPEKYEPSKAAKQPFLNVPALAAYKVKEVGRSRAWYSPGYYSLQFVYDVDQNRLEALRKQLASDKFNVVETRFPPPIMFWRDEAKVQQMVEVPTASTAYSDLTRTVAVKLEEHPLGTAGLKMWPKALLNSKPPLKKEDIYPFPFLRDLKLLSIDVQKGMSETYATVLFTSPLTPRALADKLEPSFGKDWHVLRGRNTIRFTPKGRLQAGPYQVDLQRLITSGTRVMVVSRGITPASKG